MGSDETPRPEDVQHRSSVERDISSTTFAKNDAFVRDFFRPLMAEARGSLGRFQIRDCLGQGTFGTVYRALDTILNREVAIKLPSERFAWSESELTRFYDEAMVAADLNHHAIIRVFDCGKFSEGRPYICMEFCPGKSLSHWLSEAKSGIRNYHTTAKLVALMAEAVHHAHEKGVVHCDLKPQNTLLEPQTRMGIPSDVAVKLEGDWFIPRICDFGLARFVAREGLPSTPGGTPAYMAPEQWEGRVAPSVDIFALGVVLFQLLTNELPYSSVNRSEAVKERQRTPIGRLKYHRVPRDLEAICLSCLRFDAVERYRSANELRADLRRFLNDEAVSVRRAGPLQATLRFARRHRIAALILGTVLFGLLGTAWQWWRLRTETLSHITTLASRLVDVEPEAVLPVVRELKQYAQQTSHVERALERPLPPDAAGARSNVRRQLSWLAISPDDEFTRSLSQAIIGSLPLGPRELVAIRGLVQEMHLSGSQKQSIGQDLWRHLDTMPSGEPSGEWLALVAHLNELDAKNPNWERVPTPKIVDALVMQDLSFSDAWTAAFAAPSADLKRRLIQIATDERQPSQAQYFATLMLVQYAQRGADVDWVELYLSASPDKFSYCRPLLMQATDRAGLLARLRRQAEESRVVKNDVDDRVAKRAANALAASMLLGDADHVWPFFQYSNTLATRYYLIERLAPLHVEAGLLVHRLEVEDDLNAVYALLLALAGFEQHELRQDDLQIAMQYVRNAYLESPSASVHSASKWVMTHWQEPMPEATRTRDEALHRLSYVPPANTGATWFQNSLGQTMAALQSPRHHLFNDRGHELYAFAISATETTKEEFAAFLESDARERSHDAGELLSAVFEKRERKRPSTDGPNTPRGLVNWDEAARFCNWLSLRESLEPCYEADSAGRMVPRKDHLLQTGYRLPTALEWQVACGVGMVTERFFGNAESLFSQYAWCAVNVRDAKLQPVAQLRPNPLGLFDLYGNVTEWCDDDFDGDKRRIRGGAVGDWPLRISTKQNDFNFANTDQPQYVSGFRLACTLIPPIER